jgi:hypothetical protein
MKLPQLMNNFLENFYAYFSASVVQGACSPGTSFYEAIILPAVRAEPFRRKLLDDPEAVLSDFGMVLPSGMTIRFLENTEDTIHIVIPPYVGE